MICVAVEVNVVFAENVTKRKKIEYEKHGTKDRTLRNTSRDGEGMGGERLELKELSAV